MNDAIRALHLKTLGNLFPPRQLIFGILLFKILPLPHSR